MKQCPFCAEQIQDAATICRYCGSALDQVVPPGVTRLSTAATAPDQYQEARELARQGHKISAIKRVRQTSGVDLKAAKAIVEGFDKGAPSIPKTGPESISAPKLLGAALLVLIVASLIAYLIYTPAH